MKVSTLTHNPKNPRTITDAKLAQFRKTIKEFGDLSGIVFNQTTKQLVGGHQRTKLEDGDVVITKKYAKPTRTGTVREGYVVLYGERHTYREVRWDDMREKAAALAANKNAGEWDLPQVQEWIKELDQFDVGIDLDLTMFDAEEIADFKINFSDEETSSKEVENNSQEIDLGGFSRLTHECPKCGFTFGAAKR